MPEDDRPTLPAPPPFKDNELDELADRIAEKLAPLVTERIDRLLEVIERALEVPSNGR